MKVIAKNSLARNFSSEDLYEDPLINSVSLPVRLFCETVRTEKIKKKFFPTGEMDFHRVHHKRNWIECLRLSRGWKEEGEAGP